MMAALHKSLIEKLRSAQLAAGGPVSLSQFLRLARPIIQPLRAKRVPWAWLASRLLAVHQTSIDAEIPENVADATDRQVKIVSTIWRRISAETGKTTEDRHTDKAADANAEPPTTSACEEVASHLSVNEPKSAPAATGPPKMSQSMLRILHDHEQAEKIGQLHD